MRAKKSAAIAAVAGIGAIIFALGQTPLAGQVIPGAATTSPPSSPTFNPGPALLEFNKETTELYSYINAAMVRVSVVQSPVAVLHGALKTEFDEWLKTDEGKAAATPGLPGGGGGGGAIGGGGRRARGGGDGRNNGRGGNPNGAGMQGGPGGGGGGGGRDGFGPRGGGGPGPGGRGGGLSPNAQLSNQVQAFLLKKAESLQGGDADQAAQMRGLAFRVGLNSNGFQGDMSALVIDNDGHAILPVGLVREAHAPGADPIKVTRSDGTAGTAEYIASNVFGGYTVLKIDKTVAKNSVKISGARLMAGQLLMTVAVGQGVPELVIASGKIGPGATEDRFAVPIEDRNGAFVFDISGGLEALVSSGGAGFLGDRQSMMGARLEREVDYMIHEGKDILPRPVGLAFAAVDKDSLPGRLEAVRALLKGRRGAFVKSVDHNSPAERTGLKAGDVIVSINGQNVSEYLGPDGRGSQQLLRLQVDLVTRPQGVTMTVIRQENGVEKEESLTSAK